MNYDVIKETRILKEDDNWQAARDAYKEVAANHQDSAFGKEARRRLEVLEKNEARIRCRVLIPGELKSKRHINLPGVKVNLPSFTEKDRADATVGLEEGIDFLALSFVREAKDIELLRAFAASASLRRCAICRSTARSSRPTRCRSCRAW